MTRLLNNFFLLAAFASLSFCQQENRETTQQKFRDRQQAIQEQTPANEDKDAATPAPTPVPERVSAATEENSPKTRAGDKVVGVKDGDTIELLRNGQTITVRLHGVDTPEKNQDYGQRARQFTSDLVFGKYVQLIPHNTDRYGRTVGSIILPDGRSLNEELVRNGYAWHYKAYSKDKKLANLEADARRYKRGLWQDPNPTPPWDFRKEKRTGNSSAAASDVSSASVPAGATKRKVHICNSTGSAVYHVDANCSVLKRCKAEVLTITEAVAIREYGRRADKTCSK